MIRLDSLFPRKAIGEFKEPTHIRRATARFQLKSSLECCLLDRAEHDEHGDMFIFSVNINF